VNLAEAIERIRCGRARNVMALCPAHGDRSPSLSVGAGRAGRILLRCNAGCPTESILSAVGLSWSNLRGTASLPPACPPPSQREGVEDPSKAEERAKWPAFEPPGPKDLEAIAHARGIPVEALHLAVARGILWTTTHRGVRSWIVTDESRMAAQARRLDGQPWRARDGSTRKADTLRGSIGAWPIGLAALKLEHRAVLLVEGGPDLLAAHAVILAEGREADAAAIAMLGAANNPRESELYRLAGRRVRVVEHDDDAGRNAGPRWAGILRPHVESVDGLRFAGLVQSDGQRCKDLNDALRVDADTFEQNRFLWGVTP
jgi:hypothetical protein